MITITQKDYDKIQNDYKGVITFELWNFRKDFPKEYIGKKTMAINDSIKGTILLTEGLHFEIV
jgi:hypothetical protein